MNIITFEPYVDFTIRFNDDQVAGFARMAELYPDDAINLLGAQLLEFIKQSRETKPL